MSACGMGGEARVNPRVSLWVYPAGPCPDVSLQMTVGGAGAELAQLKSLTPRCRGVSSGSEAAVMSSQNAVS